MKNQTCQDFEALVTSLVQALGHCVLYSAQHPVVASEIRVFLAGLELFLSRSGVPALFLQVADGEIHLQGQPLVGATIRGRRLVELVRGNQSGGIVFRRGVGATEVLALFALYKSAGPPRPLAEAQGVLARDGQSGIQLVATDERPTWFAAASRAASGPRADGLHRDDSAERRAAVPLFQDIFQAVEESFGQAARGNGVDVSAARTLGETLGKASRDGLQGIMSLAAYPDYDTYTVGHSIRVALLAVCVASRIEERPEVITELGTAALLHDVGKAQIPHEILYKPAALEPEERQVMSRHACLGAHILLESEAASTAAIGAAWGHHRRFDRRGYPGGHPWALSSAATSLLQVCDVFEALTADRPYKAALSPRLAYEVMFSDRGAFDPRALATFVRQVGMYPPGYCLALSDGRVARVCSAGSAVDRPQVRYLDDGSFSDLSLPGCRVSVEDILGEAEAIERLQRGAAVPSLVREARPGAAAAEASARAPRGEQGPTHAPLCADGCAPEPGSGSAGLTAGE